MISCTKNVLKWSIVCILSGYIFSAVVSSPVTAQSNAQLFPPELVQFQPGPTNPIFTGRGPGHWDEHIRERGWILREGDRWHLWYTGYEGAGGSQGSLLKLGYASSPNGLNWERHAANPIFDSSWIEDMCVLKHNGTYIMVAEGKFDIAQLLTSSDGIQWTLVGPLDIRQTSGQPISDGPRGTPTLWIEDDTWYLFYERRDLGIWLAASPDRKIWTNVSDEPVIGLGPGPYDQSQVALNQIVKHGGRYYAYYHGAGAEQPRLWCTCVAVSSDLRHWTKYENNPLLPKEENKSSGILVHDGQLFRLYTMHKTVAVHFYNPKR